MKSILRRLAGIIFADPTADAGAGQSNPPREDTSVATGSDTSNNPGAELFCPVNCLDVITHLGRFDELDVLLLSGCLHSPLSLKARYGIDARRISVPTPQETQDDNWLFFEAKIADERSSFFSNLLGQFDYAMIASARTILTQCDMATRKDGLGITRQDGSPLRVDLTDIKGVRILILEKHRAYVESRFEESAFSHHGAIEDVFQFISREKLISLNELTAGGLSRIMEIPLMRVDNFHSSGTVVRVKGLDSQPYSCEKLPGGLSAAREFGVDALSMVSKVDALPTVNNWKEAFDYLTTGDQPQLAKLSVASARRFLDRYSAMFPNPVERARYDQQMAEGSKLALLLERMAEDQYRRISDEPVQSSRPVAHRHQYHLSHDGKNFGPYTFEVIERQILDGDINANSLVWRSGMYGWQIAKEIPELESLFHALPDKAASELATAEADGFMLRVNGIAQGPYTLVQMGQLIEAGEVDGNSLVRHAKSARWLDVNAVAELAEYLAISQITDDHYVNQHSYYTSTDGATRGPFNHAELVGMQCSGALREDSKVWRKGLRQWQCVSELPELQCPLIG